MTKRLEGIRKLAKSRGMRNDQSSSKGSVLNHQLDRYFLACSTLAGVAAMTSTQEVNAAVVWSGVRNIDVATTNGFGGIYIDIEGMTSLTPSAGGGVGAGLMPSWDLNPYSSGGNLRAYTDFTASKSGIVYRYGTDRNVVDLLVAGTLIDNSQPFGNYTRMVQSGGEWQNTNGFVGIVFSNTPSSTLHYGWVRFNTTGVGGFPATVVDWAYESTPGVGIIAGTIPEPSTVALGCLALGAVGVSAWRRRKQD